MLNREEFRAQLADLVANDPEKLPHIIETMADRMETMRLLADSAMEVGVVLAWPVGYPPDVRDRAFELSVRAMAELAEILDEAVEEAGDEK